MNKGDNFSRKIANSSVEKITLFPLSKIPYSALIVSWNILVVYKN